MKQVFFPADILLPKEGTDMTKWSVVACDQFTSEPEYWEDVYQIVGDAPSTGRLILPEVYLEEADVEERIQTVHENMESYLSGDLFTEYKNAMLYIERTDSLGKVRAGLIGCIDLEQYDYHKGSTSMVRATEETVLERIPPRIRVRENAPMELPHIMILIDDIQKTVIEPLGEMSGELQKVYDFTLMKNGGSLKGWLLDEKQQKKVTEALDALAEKMTGGNENKDALVFAMGDGNHSLATAKEYYERLKAAHPEEDLSSHPARYALTELVNLHSPALEFEPIYRIVTEVEPDALMEEMTQKLGLLPETEGQTFYAVKNGEKTGYTISRPSSKLTVGSLQNFLDTYQKEHGVHMDYIHGEETLMTLTKRPDAIGFLMPVMGKEELFPTVMADGALPRKTFSMGHAEDKRYYTECRKIK